MGYDVFITRARHHFEGAQTPIAKGDWRALIDNDPDLDAPDEAYPCYAVWSGPSRLQKPWIDWASGNLFTRSPDDAVLRKLIELAELLGARVQGREGEIYRIEDDAVTWERAPRARAAREGELDFEPPSPVLPPKLEDLLEEPIASPAAERPPEKLRSEKLFGPKPRYAKDEHDVPSGGHDLHADASFARRPTELLGAEPTPRPVKDVPFRIGDRVMTSWGRPATVVSIDPRADGGVGHIEIRYDDGRVATTSCMNHGLEPSEI